MFALIIVAAVVVIAAAVMAPILIMDAHKANAEFRTYRDTVNRVSAELSHVTRTAKTAKDEIRRISLKQEMDRLIALPGYADL